VDKFILETAYIKRTFEEDDDKFYIYR